MQRDTVKEAETAEAKSAAFDKFLQEPMVKLGLSMLPPAQDPDLVKNLLRSAFDAGHGHGTGAVLIDMLTTMFKDRKDGQPHKSF